MSEGCVGFVVRYCVVILFVLVSMAPDCIAERTVLAKALNDASCCRIGN